MDLKIRKNKQAYTIADIYKSYTMENIDVDVVYLRFKRILEEINKSILQVVFEASQAFKMPHGLGYICIVKYKPKGYTPRSLSIDFKSTREEGKNIYHLNEHSGGYKYRLYWSKIPMSFPDRYKYALILVRQNKRKLAKLIFNKQDYINIDDLQIYKM